MFMCSYIFHQYSFVFQSKKKLSNIIYVVHNSWFARTLVDITTWRSYGRAHVYRICKMLPECCLLICTLYLLYLLYLNINKTSKTK